MSSQSLLKTVHVLCLSRKSAIRLLSVSSCNTYPRTPSTAESKWGDYLNRKSNPEGSETILTTKFGGIRLDSMNTDRNEEGMTVGSLSNIAESEESTNSDFYFESETPSQSTLYEVNKIKHEVTSNFFEKKENTRTAKVKSAIDENGENKQQPPTVKAYKFINHLRRENILEKRSTKESKRFSKETEVLKIGESLKSRIAKVTKPETSVGQKKLKDSKELEESPTLNHLNGRVDPKYLPTDLSKLTSVEVISLLKNGIVYDKSKYLT